MWIFLAAMAWVAIVLFFFGSRVMLRQMPVVNFFWR